MDMQLRNVNYKNLELIFIEHNMHSKTNYMYLKLQVL